MTDEALWMSRMEALESRIAFLEHHLDGLNRAMMEQDRSRVALTQTCEALRTRLDALGDPQGNTGNALEPPPPHY